MTRRVGTAAARQPWAPASASDAMSVVPRRRLVAGPVEAWFRLRPGDRPVVAPGEAVVRGAPLAERLREPATMVVAAPASPDAGPGTWLSHTPARRGRPGPLPPIHGERLFHSGGHWRVASGEPGMPLEAPFAGIVREVVPGVGIRLEAPIRSLAGADAIGGPVSGRVEIRTARDGRLRAPEIDVGAAGSIIVAGATIDAEAITRARAVGVRGIVVNGLGVKERREIAASEQRGQAGAHGLPPFAVLVLEGAVGRPIASPVMAVLQALEGHVGAIIGDPAGLTVEAPELVVPEPAPGWVRVGAGPMAGAEGTWMGLAGVQRFAGGVQLEAAWVQLGGKVRIAVPIGDLERFA